MRAGGGGGGGSTSAWTSTSVKEEVGLSAKGPIRGGLMRAGGGGGVIRGLAQV